MRNSFGSFLSCANHTELRDANSAPCASAVAAEQEESKSHGSGSYCFEPLLNLKEAAPLLGVHWKTLELMARKQEVPALKLGKCWKFRASALDEWLQHRLHSPHNNHARANRKGSHP